MEKNCNEITIGCGDKTVSSFYNKEENMSGICIANRHDDCRDIGVTHEYPEVVTIDSLDALVVIKTNSVVSLMALKRRIEQAIHFLDSKHPTSVMKSITYEYDERGNIKLPNEAPFDGNPILLKTSEGVVQGWWCPQENGSYEDLNDGDGFCWVLLDGDKDIELDEATHWMPLPSLDAEIENELVVVQEEHMDALVDMMRNDSNVKSLSRFSAIRREFNNVR